MSKIIVAIDGPAGSGKSSVSKAAAIRLGFGYLDTGAAYRALAWAVQNLEGFALEDLANIDLPTVFDYAISTNPHNYWVKVGQTDLTEAIRSAEVAESVAQVASIPEVRTYMKQLTRAIVDECPYSGIVVEGRDITTVALPAANHRILLTASEEVRLRRRSSELGDKTAQQVAKQVSERDRSDSKVVDFLNPAPGVTLLDSTNLNFDQTVDAVVRLVNAAD